MARTRVDLELQAAPPRACTNLRLRQLTRQVSQHYDAQMAAAGLKTTQYSLLAAVIKLGPARPADLAAALKMDPSTLTRNLKPLMAAGWVSMTAGADARTRAVSITDSGRAKHAEARRLWKVAQDSLHQTLGESRVQALHTLIRESLALLAPDDGVAKDG
jgi:DNA-binding MarR family transcriptional regulator